MKTKLLRKIRKQYSIVYYPAGVKVQGLGVFEVDLYHVSKNGSIGHFYKSKNACIKSILNELSVEYGKYSVKYKHNKSKGTKVWYNV